MEPQIFDTDQWLQALATKTRPLLKAQSLAFYSSLVGGITTEQILMSIPIEDHMVHRGDAVFEAFKVINGKYFLLEEHLKRLGRSSSRIGLKIPVQDTEFKEIIQAIYKACKTPDVLIRLYVARGPGGYTTNPYECEKSQLYVVATQYKAPPEEKYINGVKIGRSTIPVKNSWFPQVKSCNYLPNVLMRKEAVERGLEFVVSYDEQGFLAESFTENIVIVNSKGKLLRPKLDRILDGTTMLRALELAKQKGFDVGEAQITEKDVLEARELIMIGTTLDAMPVSRYEHTTYAVGMVAKQLRRWIEEDYK